MSKEEFLKKKRERIEETESEVAEEIRDEINLVQVKVLEILDEHEIASDSYAVLVTRFHEKELEEKNVDRTVFMLTDEERKDLLTSPESITRAFRKLQENPGVQFTSEKVQEERDRREKGFEEVM